MRPTPLRPHKGGGRRAAGSTTPQLPECAEDGDPGKGLPCTRPAHFPVPPTLYCPVGKSVAGLLNSSRSWSVARGLSRVLFSAAVGAKTPNSGGTEQHRSTIALAGSLRPKKASVEAHQAAGDQSTSYNLLITSLKCVSVTDRPKTFVRPLTSLLLCCARTTAHVAVFRVRQQRNLHLGSLLALFLKLSLILCTKESSQIQPAYT